MENDFKFCHWKNPSPYDNIDLKKRLLQQEAEWISSLNTITSWGLNQELKLKAFKSCSN